LGGIIVQSLGVGAESEAVPLEKVISESLTHWPWLIFTFGAIVNAQFQLRVTAG